MRIVFVVNNYPPRVGGLENHVSSLARHLAAAGHEVVVHTMSDAGTRRTTATEQGVEVHRWPEAFQIGGLLGFPTLGAARGLWRAITRSGADLVSTHTRFFPLTWLAVAAARAARLPVVHTEHGSGHVASPSPVIKVGSRVVDETFGRLSLRGADAVLGVSEEVVAFVRALSGVGGHVFYNAIEAPEVAGTPPHLRRHLVFVGRIVPGKGWEDFLKVVASVDDDVTAEVLGDGQDLSELRRHAAALGLGGRLAIRGRVPMAEVFTALAGAILVNPTRLSEGFQTTLLEALAVGARVVTYPVPGTSLLAAQGAPITVVDRSTNALLAGVRSRLADAPEAVWGAEEIAAWTWSARSREYVELVSGVRSRRAR
ncbi:MAG TPA: glycosyltransferase family 4 protein [Propionibacterium sp.]|nr:glycosyltransferase family 4 protein [Propionibacterium sp.]